MRYPRFSKHFFGGDTELFFFNCLPYFEESAHFALCYKVRWLVNTHVYCCNIKCFYVLSIFRPNFCQYQILYDWSKKLRSYRSEEKDSSTQRKNLVCIGFHCTSNKTINWCCLHYLCTCFFITLQFLFLFKKTISSIVVLHIFQIRKALIHRSKSIINIEDLLGTLLGLSAFKVAVRFAAGW